jgi:nicotinamide phosphoribosyltransferase
MFNNKYNLMYAADFYKVSHKAQYPEEVSTVHSVLVARGASYNDQISKDRFFWFGHSLFLRKLTDFENWFMNLDLRTLREHLDTYKNFLDARLGGSNSVDHWLSLWGLQELPLVIHAQPERTWQEFQKPLIVVENTDPEFAWLTGFIETSMLSNLWPVTTAANRAKHIRESIEAYMKGYTEEELAAVDFMGHDFSYRGMPGDEAATLTGCGHLSVFKGSDTIPAILAMEEVYGEITGFSVPATEHSVMCAGGQETEAETYERILDIYPSGIVSIVSDTWDYFKVLTETLPDLKDRIMARDGKVVIRPDSGDPVDIVCGVQLTDFTKQYEGYDGDLDVVLDEIADILCGRDVWGESRGVAYFTFRGVTYAVEMNRSFGYEGDYVYEPGEPWVVEEFTPEEKGTLELLDETFGHTLDSAGLKVLDSHIGIIYGDGMNQLRIKQMLERMVAKGYSPLNIVFGIGAYTYQFTTRDELGFAFKATAVEKAGVWEAIQKNPVTDPGKKSLAGVQDTSEMELVFG